MTGGFRVVVAASLCAAFVGCGGESGRKPDYEVKVTAPSHTAITLYGCPGCPTTLNPHGFLKWREERSLPRTYAIAAGSHRSNCPPLTAISGGADDGKRWDLTASPSGECVLDDR